MRRPIRLHRAFGGSRIERGDTERSNEGQPTNQIRAKRTAGRANAERSNAKLSVLDAEFARILEVIFPDAHFQAHLDGLGFELLGPSYPRG